MRDSVICQHTGHLIWHILMNETHVQQIAKILYFSVLTILLYMVSFFVSHSEEILFKHMRSDLNEGILLIWILLSAGLPKGQKTGKQFCLLRIVTFLHTAEEDKQWD